MIFRYLYEKQYFKSPKHTYMYNNPIMIVLHMRIYHYFLHKLKIIVSTLPNFLLNLNAYVPSPLNPLILVSPVSPGSSLSLKKKKKFITVYIYIRYQTNWTYMIIILM